MALAWTAFPFPAPGTEDARIVFVRHRGSMSDATFSPNRHSLARHKSGARPRRWMVGGAKQEEEVEMRGSVVLVGVISIVLGTAGPAIAAKGRGTEVAECTTGYRRTPASITLTCADGGLVVRNARWTKWTANVATGTGILSESPLTGAKHDYPAYFLLDSPIRCWDGHTAFARLQIEATDAGQFRDQEVFNLGCSTNDPKIDSSKIVVRTVNPKRDGPCVTLPFASGRVNPFSIAVQAGDKVTINTSGTIGVVWIDGNRFRPPNLTSRLDSRTWRFSTASADALRLGVLGTGSSVTFCKSIGSD